jgi:hypothetical protein
MARGRSNAALRARYNNKLENSVYLAGRDAVQELGSFSRRDNVRRWFRELEYYGFIEMVRLAHHGLNGHGRAPHYRLTEEAYLGKPPTRDFLNWDGTMFHEQKSPKDYQTKNRSRGPYAGSTLAHTLGPLIDQPAPMNGTSGPCGEAMYEHNGGPPAGAITSLTTPLLEAEPVAASWQWPEDININLPADWAELEMTEAEFASLWQEVASQSNNKSIPVRDYALALGMVGAGSQFVSWRDKN